MSRKMILRIESQVGTRRIQINPSETTFNLFEKVHSEFDLNSYSFALYKQRSQKDEILCHKSRTVDDIGLKHGDMLYMTPINGALIFPQLSTSTEFQNNTPSGDPGKFESLPSTSSADSSQTSGLGSAKKHIKGVKEDEVDVQLSKLDGKIQRNRDEKLCHHTKNALCIHCCPLEPSNESYLREHNIKHMSFHSYLRKLTSDISGGKFAAMEDTSCRIKNGCKDHLPWPKGICSKCQPNAVTLNRQIYRHVDNIQFENTQIVERFLNYWRITGLQRFGFLYGNYEIHPDVPLGIKATVAAIYEPPQENDQSCIRVLKDDKEELVDEIAAGLGLTRVGYIFTDLVAQDLQKGTVKHTRNANTHFLTAQECITSGKYQNMHPNPTKLSSNGYYGSKFVTVCVTGDKSNQVHMEGYQVSNQCMALVRDDCLVPTKDAPELGYVRESSDKQYVPDVFYKDKDSYGNEVPKMARPLPVEYLLVDVPASTPLTPHYTFNCDTTKEGFPIENRIVDGQVQDFTALARYMSQFLAQDQFPSAINDFHLLLYIAAMDTLPMKDYMGALLDAIKTKDAEAAVEWSKSEQWATVVQLIAATNSSPPHSRPTSVAGTSTFAASGEVQWTCPFCTFLNSSDIDTCEMCTLPRSSVPQ